MTEKKPAKKKPAKKKAAAKKKSQEMPSVSKIRDHLDGMLARLTGPMTSAEEWRDIAQRAHAIGVTAVTERDAAKARGDFALSKEDDNG